MKLNNTFAIGCLVQFYEIDIIEDYLKSVHLALEDIEIKDAKLKDGMLTIKMERIVPEEDKPVAIKIK